MVLSIEMLETNKHFDAWDQFARRHNEATFCHLSGWKTVIEVGAGQVCPYLLARRGTEVVGILPLTVKKHPIFGKALISNMFCVYGGAVAEDGATIHALYDAAWELAKKENISVLECRTKVADHQNDEAWHINSKSATFLKILSENDEKQLMDIPRKQRAVVRKSLKNNLTTDWNGELSVFYDLYARSVLSLGTPVFPRKLFEVLSDVFVNDVQIQITSNEEGVPVASLMSFYFRDVVMPYYAGGNDMVRPLAAHDFMYFQLMLKARERGVTTFDFGRSKIDSGPYKFKKNWGFEPQPLEYQWRLHDGAEMPEMSQHSGMYGIMTKMWKHLPLPVSKVIGPHLSRHLG